MPSPPGSVDPVLAVVGTVVRDDLMRAGHHRRARVGPMNVSYVIVQSSPESWFTTPWSWRASNCRIVRYSTVTSFACCVNAE